MKEQIRNSLGVAVVALSIAALVWVVGCGCASPHSDFTRAAEGQRAAERGPNPYGDLTGGLRPSP